MNPSPNPDKPTEKLDQEQSPADNKGIVKDIKDIVATEAAGGCWQGCFGCLFLVLVGLFLTAQTAFAVFR